MADNTRYYGFRWIKSLLGVPPPPAMRMRVASAYQGTLIGGTSVDINIGDPVRFLDTGYAALAYGNEFTGNNGQDIFGVVVGILPYYNGTRMQPGNRLPGGTTYGTNLERMSYIMVQPVAGQVFACHADDIVTATTEATYLALIGENVDHRFTIGAEPKATPLLDVSTHVATTAQWRILDISQTMNNQDYAGAYVELYVTCNETQIAPFVTAGI